MPAYPDTHLWVLPALAPLPEVAVIPRVQLPPLILRQQPQLRERHVAALAVCVLLKLPRQHIHGIGTSRWLEMIGLCGHFCLEACHVGMVEGGGLLSPADNAVRSHVDRKVRV